MATELALPNSEDVDQIDAAGLLQAFRNPDVDLGGRAASRTADGRDRRRVQHFEKRRAAQDQISRRRLGQAVNSAHPLPEQPLDLTRRRRRRRLAQPVVEPLDVAARRDALLGVRGKFDPALVTALVIVNSSWARLPLRTRWSNTR